jgi:hypothetical protein
MRRDPIFVVNRLINFRQIWKEYFVIKVILYQPISLFNQ